MNGLKKAFGKIKAGEAFKENAVEKLIALNNKLIAKDGEKYVLNPSVAAAGKIRRPSITKRLVLALSMAAALILTAVLVPVITVNSLPPVTLSVPVIEVDGGTVSWNKIKNADGYEVSVTEFGKESERTEVKTNRYSLENNSRPNVYQVSVRALSSKRRYSASVFAEPKTVGFDGEFYREVAEDEILSTLAADERFIVEGDCLIDTATETLMMGRGTSVIPAYVKNIADFAFSWSEFERIVIPASVVRIGEDAFKIPDGKMPGTVVMEGLVPPECKEGSFDGADKIEVASDALEAYKAAWPQYESKITAK